MAAKLKVFAFNARLKLIKTFRNTSQAFKVLKDLFQSLCKSFGSQMGTQIASWLLVVDRKIPDWSSEDLALLGVLLISDLEDVH